MEMEEQCLALQAIISASYFMGRKEFTILGMGERAALMADQMKKWCPSDIIKMRIVVCRNPAARTTGDMSSLAFTLKHSGTSKILASEVNWYHTMPPKESFASKRLQQSEQALKTSLETVVVSKDTAKAELSNLMERLRLPVDNGNQEGLADAMISARRAIIAHTNALRSNQMSLMQYVASAKASIPVGKEVSDSSSTATHRDVSKLALQASPRKKVTMQAETIEQSSPPCIDIKRELKETSTVAPVVTTPKPRRINRMVSESADGLSMCQTPPSVAPSDMTNMTSTPGTTPSRAKRSAKSVSDEEAVHMGSFAAWFRSNVTEDPTFAGILQTAIEDKNVGDTPFAISVMNYIRARKKQDRSYDVHNELNNKSSESYKWAVQTKSEVIDL